MTTETRSAPPRQDADAPSANGRRSPEPTRRFLVEGLCCATEARQIEGRLGDHPGVASLRIDPVQHTLDVAGSIDAGEVRRAIAELGMSARPVGDDAPPSGDERGPARSRLILTVVSGVLWLGSLVAAWAAASTAVVAGLAVGAVAAGGWHVFPRGVRAARRLALDMHFLMSAAALGALLIGEYVEAASILFLFSLAQLLESASMDRARDAIRSLMELAPSQATVLRDGEEVRVAAEAVRVGETVVVRPGERIPVDGQVLVGRSSVDQAAITGESVPVPKEPDDEVFAGTVNGPGALEIRSSRPAADTTLARILHSVEDAQASRAPSQRFVDRFARIYTPAVVGAAGALAVLPPLLTEAAWEVWIYRALALLVVACPCALVISTPVTVVSALAGAARRGILIRGGLHLENAGRARVVALDKTGTLTEGRPEVVDVRAIGEVDADRVLSLAAAVEGRSEHPLAEAIRQHARDRRVDAPPAVDLTARPGLGAEGTVEGARVVVGNERLFAGEGGVPPHVADLARRLEEAGRTLVLVGRAAGGGEGPGSLEILGVIALSDRVRPGAAAALAGLREAGIDHVAVLTGDRPAAAAAVADVLAGGATDVRAGLLPDDKVRAVRELRRRYGPVIMVGDGINDAPALAAADVGVAMGAAGTDVALETADIALMADDLSRLPDLVRLSRKAEGIIRGNIAFALLVKAVFVVLAVTGLATLWMAVLADMGASLLVIANGMRALRVAPASGVTSPAAASPA